MVIRGTQRLFFCKITVQRSIYCLEIFNSQERLKISGWPIYSSRIIKIFLLNLPAIFGGYDVHILLPKYCWQKHIPTFLFCTYQPKLVILFARKVKKKNRLFSFLLNPFWNYSRPLQSYWLSAMWFITLQITFFPPNHIFSKSLNHVYSRTVFALYRNISVSNTKWDVKAFLFPLFNILATWSIKYLYWLNSAILKWL